MNKQSTMKLGFLENAMRPLASSRRTYFILMFSYRYTNCLNYTSVLKWK